MSHSLATLALAFGLLLSSPPLHPAHPREDGSSGSRSAGTGLLHEALLAAKGRPR
jgi:hypothetical protein